MITSDKIHLRIQKQAKFQMLKKEFNKMVELYG